MIVTGSVTTSGGENESWMVNVLTNTPAVSAVPVICPVVPLSSSPGASVPDRLKLYGKHAAGK